MCLYLFALVVCACVLCYVCNSVNTNDNNNLLFDAPFLFCFSNPPPPEGPIGPRGAEGAHPTHRPFPNDSGALGPATPNCPKVTREARPTYL